tara:strand:+ start:27811 stop:27957 length:147 start_codon:yes stop_codon:yes gene_type:complete
MFLSAIEDNNYLINTKIKIPREVLMEQKLFKKISGNSLFGGFGRKSII